jgi:hypothetical protein
MLGLEVQLSNVRSAGMLKAEKAPTAPTHLAQLAKNARLE